MALGTILIVVVTAWRNQRALEYFGKKWIRRRFPTFYTKLEKWTDSMINGMASLKSGKRILEVSGYSILIWLFHVMIAVLLIQAFRLDIRAWAGVVVVIINSFLLMIPISPGNIGSFQFIVINVLHEFFNVPKAGAAAFSLVLHVMDIVPVFVFGIYFLFTNHITFRAMRREAEEEAHQSQLVP
jgi:uncharacterized protein (TIRG00374 family)